MTDRVKSLREAIKACRSEMYEGNLMQTILIAFVDMAEKFADVAEDTDGE